MGMAAHRRWEAERPRIAKEGRQRQADMPGGEEGCRHELGRARKKKGLRKRG